MYFSHPMSRTMTHAIAHDQEDFYLMSRDAMLLRCCTHSTERVLCVTSIRSRHQVSRVCTSPNRADAENRVTQRERGTNSKIVVVERGDSAAWKLLTHT